MDIQKEFKKWLLETVCNEICRERKEDEKAEDKTFECIECEQTYRIGFVACATLMSDEYEKQQDENKKWAIEMKQTLIDKYGVDNISKKNKKNE